MTETWNKPELPAVGMLSDLEAEDRALLGDYGQFLPIQAGQVIIQAGNPQNDLYFVIGGLLHVTIDVDGRPKLVARVEKAETLGEINIFDPGSASATVTAQEFSQIWKASREDIDAFVKAYPEAGSVLLTGIINVMCRRIRNMNDKVADSEGTDLLGKFW